MLAEPAESLTDLALAFVTLLAMELRRAPSLHGHWRAAGAAYRRHPLAGPVLLAIAASIAAARTTALSPALVGEVGL